jgi:hypothetical protein
VKKTALVLAACVAALALFGQSGQGPKAPSYAMEIKITPVGGTPINYTAEATVKDLGSGETVFSPRLQVAAGKNGIASSDVGKGKLDYILSVSIEGESKQANFFLEIHDGETLLASQKAAVKLR